MRLVYALLAWAALAIGLFVYFDKGTAFPGAAPAPVAQAANDDALYTGAIVIVPFSGDDCRQIMLDNRTGRMWEGGYISCDAVAEVLANSQPDSKERAGRLHAIGAFFHEGN